MNRRFDDRRDAGQALAVALKAYARLPGLLVLALPRGGVPVAHEVARALGAELDVLVVRKVGAPGHPELAVGAIASGGAEVLDNDTLSALAITRSELETTIARERAELARRERAYRGNRPPLRVNDRTVIVVDDGLATGATMQVAVEALGKLSPQRVIVAVPVASDDAVRRLTRFADGVVCVMTPEPFLAVGHWYVDFEQTSDEEVCALLAQAQAPEGA